MLTVKHVDTDGTELILEAERVEMVQAGDRFKDGIFLDRATVDRPRTEAEKQAVSLVCRPYKHVIHFVEARSSDDTTPMVYVMNRFGATVATYKL